MILRAMSQEKPLLEMVYGWIHFTQMALQVKHPFQMNTLN